MVVRKLWPLIDDLTIFTVMSIVKLVFFANLLVKFANSFCDAAKKSPAMLGYTPGFPKTMTQYESNNYSHTSGKCRNPLLRHNQYLILEGRKRELAKNATFSFFSPVDPDATDAAS